MPQRQRSIRSNSSTCAILVQPWCPRCSFGQRSRRGHRTKAPAAAPAAAEQQPSPYAGSDTCKTCHEDIYTAFVKSPHNAIETSKRLKRVGQACEACHGPGATHAGSATATDIKNPGKLAPAETDKLCLGCHLNQATPVGYIRSSHATNQIACTSCHSVHGHTPAGAPLVVRGATAVNGLCRDCHQNVWASFQKPDHHKVPEGAMSCVDCHNPHGTQRVAMQQTASTNEPGCFKCHADKRGPFTFQHQPCSSKAAIAAMSRTDRPTRACWSEPKCASSVSNAIPTCPTAIPMERWVWFRRPSMT